MRLLRCLDLEFEIVHDPASVSYAILSHRWQEEEITFQDMQGDRSPHKRKKGFQKIEAFREKALEHNMTHIWIDTCCIDKTNAVELAEAINSMYRWYGQASLCVVYFFDFKLDISMPSKEDRAASLRDSLAASAWFRRSWTLQELISPKFTRFYDRGWAYIDDKTTLAPALSSITRIPEDVLRHKTPVQQLTVAERMSWAANRCCERVEDEAYSLLGIFDVNLPMIYGEGRKAFKRLLEEIIRQGVDHTMFLWELSTDSPSPLLAPHPSAFRGSWQYRTQPARQQPYAITNSGLSISLTLQPWLPGVYLGLLDCEVCTEHSPNAWSRVGMFISQCDDTGGAQRVILFGETLGFPYPGVDFAYCRRRMVVRLDMQSCHIQREEGPLHGIVIPTFGTVWGKDENFESAVRLASSDVHTMNPWDPHLRILRLQPGFAGTVAIIFLNLHSRVKAIKLGFDFDFQPVCIIDGKSSNNELSKSSFHGRKYKDREDVRQKTLLDVHCMETEGWNDMRATEDKPAMRTWRMKALSSRPWSGRLDHLYLCRKTAPHNTGFHKWIQNPSGHPVCVNFQPAKLEGGQECWKFSLTYAQHDTIPSRIDYPELQVELRHRQDPKWNANEVDWKGHPKSFPRKHWIQYDWAWFLPGISGERL